VRITSQHDHFLQLVAPLQPARAGGSANREAHQMPFETPQEGVKLSNQNMNKSQRCKLKENNNQHGSECVTT